MKKQKGKTGDLNESLMEETLQEAADTFFGTRRDIEQAVQLYQEKVDMLRRIQEGVAGRQAELHFLLCRGKDDVVSGFYRAVGVDATRIPAPGPEPAADFAKLRVPFGLPLKTRYAKVVRAAYARFVQEARDYMHGRYFNDPEDPRRKRITVHYHQLERLCREVNERIEQANQYNSPTQMMQFSKQFDIEGSEKEAIVGVPLRYNLDQELAFSPVDFTCAVLPAYPDFPPEEQARAPITRYCAGLASECPDEIRSILREVKASQRDKR